MTVLMIKFWSVSQNVSYFIAYTHTSEEKEDYFFLAAGLMYVALFKQNKNNEAMLAL